MKDERLYLIDMLETARRVQNRVAKLTLAEFDSDEDVQLALTYLLQTIGEAATRITAPTRKTMPQIPWERITSMRHLIVPDYGRVKFSIVWDTATIRVPELISVLAPIVDPMIAEAEKRKGM